ncbi:hypothetical protein BC830DRAFT_1205649 [Chytriomyces sp. MP71]|nr:hypothetical protein BC830DRAFT_1205649 [Chytriomyces sp. MP71]
MSMRTTEPDWGNMRSLLFLVEEMFAGLSLLSPLLLVGFVLFRETRAKGLPISFKTTCTAPNLLLFGLMLATSWFSAADGMYRRDKSATWFSIATAALSVVDVCYCAYSWIRGNGVFRLHCSATTYKVARIVLYFQPFLSLVCVACTFLPLGDERVLIILAVEGASVFILICLDVVFVLAYARHLYSVSASLQLQQPQHKCLQNETAAPRSYRIIASYGIASTAFCVVALVAFALTIVVSSPGLYLASSLGLNLALHGITGTLFCMKIALIQPNMMSSTSYKLKSFFASEEGGNVAAESSRMTGK